MPTIRHYIRVGQGHEIRLNDERLPVGADVELIVRFPEADASADTSIRDLFGAARTHRSADEIVEQVRQLRDDWGRDDVP